MPETSSKNQILPCSCLDLNDNVTTVRFMNENVILIKI